MRRYLFSPLVGFVPDMLSAVPGIVTVETANRFYYFKLIRFFHFKKLTAMIDFLAAYFKQYFLYHMQIFNNWLKII